MEVPKPTVSITSGTRRLVRYQNEISMTRLFVTNLLWVRASICGTHVRMPQLSFGRLSHISSMEDTSGHLPGHRCDSAADPRQMSGPRVPTPRGNVAPDAGLSRVAVQRSRFPVMRSTNSAWQGPGQPLGRLLGTALRRAALVRGPHGIYGACSGVHGWDAGPALAVAHAGWQVLGHVVR